MRQYGSKAVAQQFFKVSQMGLMSKIPYGYSPVHTQVMHIRRNSGRQSSDNSQNWDHF